MPKLKTKKAFSKRVKVTKNKKVLRSKSGKGHLLSCKTTKRKRNLRKGGLVDKADIKALKTCMPYAF